MRAALAALALTAGCAHTALPPAPTAAAPEEARERYYEQNAPRLPVPTAALFFASPLRLRDGAAAEPADLLPAVDDDSATAAAVARYQGERAAFFAVFAGGAALEIASTASTLVGVPLLVKDQKAGAQVLVAGKVAEVAGFGVMALGYLLFREPILEAREEAFRTYGPSLRQRLGLSPPAADEYQGRR